jgi:hypothetical protein
MRESLSSLLRPEAAPSLPPFDRLAPAAPLNLLAAQIEALTSPGDIVVDLHGRGAWVARSSIHRLRRSWAFESNRLTRLLAEVVLRPPDLRHLDAALQSLAASLRQERPLKQSIAALYGSRCATCERAVSVDEYLWDGEAGAPIRKTYRCTYCRDQVGGGELRHATTDAADLRRAAEPTEGHDLAYAELRARFPVVEGREGLADQLLGLYTPRAIVALHAILRRIEGDLRASSVEAALRLAFIHALLPASRLNGYPGRMAGLRIVGGRVRPPTSRQWRERDPWLLFEEGIRHVRAFIQRLDVGPGDIHARLGDHPLALTDGSSNIVLRTGPPDPRQPLLVGPVAAQVPRVRLVLTQPPLRWGVEAISHAYLASALALGRDAAAEVPIEPLLSGAAPRLTWSDTSAELRRSFSAIRPILAPDCQVVVVLDPGGPEGLVAAALAGVGAGFSVTDAQLSEEQEGVGGTLTFATSALSRPVPRTRANVVLPPLARGHEKDGPFQLAEVEREVSEVAVELLRGRGEPARFERLLGHILVGLDGAGHLRRLVGTRTFGGPVGGEGGGADIPKGPARDPIARPESRKATGQQLRGHVPIDPGSIDQGPVGAEAGRGEGIVGAAASGANPRSEAFRARDRAAAGASEAAWFGGGVRRSPSAGEHDGAAVDQVGLLLDLVQGELRRSGRRRVIEIEPGQWWLGTPHDLNQAALPLSDRVEWAVFSLLTTSGRLSEAALYDRIASMFRGPDAPDAALVRACLDSYRSLASTADTLRTNDDLQTRYAQHTAILGDIVAYGHRLGLKVWVKRSEQARELGGQPLAERLEESERRAYLPLVLHAPLEALENVDAIWYVRGRFTFLFEVEWTAMLGEPLLQRGAQIQQVGDLIRFLVIVPERTELVRYKLAHSAVLREAMERANWYILKSNHLRRLVEEEGADLERLKPLLGLDPEIETSGEQLPLFLSTEPPARRTPA